MIRLIVGTLYLIIIFCSTSFGQPLNVKDFGAKGDGQTDDYFAIKKIVDSINSRKTGSIYFPPGNYFVGKYHDGISDLRDFEFNNCNNLKIHGDRATITLNGDFNRKITKSDSKHVFSSISAIIPLKIIDCNNVIIDNLTINGGVDKMTKDKGVVETGGHLILISESENVMLSNLKLYHAQTDGLIITGKTHPCQNIRVLNVESSNNARQGMSIADLIKATFTNCKFINTGITDGAYGRHAPSAGVDIEPDRLTQTVTNVSFTNCVFENNMGSQFVCSFPSTTKDIFFDSCVFNSSDSSSKYSIIVNASGIVFQSCSFKCKKGNIYPVWHNDSCSSTFIKCNIKSSSSGFLAVNNFINSKVKIDGCMLEYTGTQRVATFFPYLVMNNLSFTNNVVNIPKQFNKILGNSMLLQNIYQKGNVFQSY